MDILEEFKSVIVALDTENIDYAIIGGLAMAIYNMPRATLDIDLLIQVESLPDAKRTVEQLGFTLSAAPMRFNNNSIQIYRLCKAAPGDQEELILDFLLVTPATLDAWNTRREVDWEGMILKVASPEGMILLKSFRGSGKDQDDIKHLRSISHED